MSVNDDDAVKPELMPLRALIQSRGLWLAIAVSAAALLTLLIVNFSSALVAERGLLRSTAGEHAAYANQTLADARDAVTRHARTLSERGFETGSTEFERLGRVLEERTMLNGLAITSAEGDALIGRRRGDSVQYGPRSGVRLDLRDREYFARARTTGMIALSEPMVVRPSQIPAIVYAAPWTREDQFRGVVAGSVALANFLSPGAPGAASDTRVLLVDAKGTALAGREIDGAMIKWGDERLTAGGFDALPSSSHPQILRTADGSRWLVAIRTLSANPRWTIVVARPFDGFLVRFIDSNWPIALVVLFALIVSSIGVGQIAARASAALSRMSQAIAQGDLAAARAIADSGPTRTDRWLPAELVRIGRGLQAFEERVEKKGERARASEQYMRAMNELLAEEIRNREAVIEQRTFELKSALGESQAGSDAKTRLIANTSHELRTPLNGILGHAELLLKEPLSDAQRHACETILRCAEGMHFVVGDLLTMAELESTGFELKRDAFDLVEEIELALDAARAGANARGLGLTESLPPALLRRRVGDRHRLRQILMNLISNALKFTEAGAITLTVRELARGRVEIAVSDTGIGIAADQIERIFAPFYQVDGSSTRSAGGTGLGLAISRELAARMGGGLAVASEPGGGSTFTLTVSLPVVDETPMPTPDDAGGLRSASRAMALASVNALVVDDAEINSAVLAAQLRALGISDPVVTHDGFAALERVSRGDINVMFLDCQMPGMDGYEVAQRVRARADLAFVRIIAVTAHAQLHDRQRCFDAGMDDYLPKPVRLEQLSGALDRALAAIHDGD